MLKLLNKTKDRRSLNFLVKRCDADNNRPQTEIALSLPNTHIARPRTQKTFNTAPKTGPNGPYTTTTLPRRLSIHCFAKLFRQSF